MTPYLLAWLAYALLLNLLLFRSKAPHANKTGPTAPPPAGPAKLLIIGGTGGSGRQLVQQALAQGHHVTAFVRNPPRFTISHPNLRVAQGDVLDYASIEAAMPGQDAVLSALGHKRMFWPTTIKSEGTRNILRAMKLCRVPRFICASSLGVGNSVGRLGLLPATLFFVPLILPFYFYDRVRQETLIAENSDTDWVIVRAATLTNGPARARYRHGPSVGSYLWPNRISRADFADFMLKQLTDDTYLGRAPGLAY